MAKLNDSLTFKHGATISNRFVQPPMLTNSGIEGEASEDTINYWKHHSKSGGMLITEYIYVTPEGGPAISWAKDRTQLAVYDDKFIPQLKKGATAMKSSGNKAIMQIAETGREASGRVALYGKPVYAPTAMDFPFLPYKVHEYSDEQIKNVIKGFGEAVKRAVEAGFDGVEIHGANHYLIQQFFSAYSNKRTDHWGGSLEKRMNFPLAVVESVMNAVKKYAPKDFIVGYRISPEEINPDSVGYTWHESTQLIKAITDKFDLDYIHLSLQAYDQRPKDSDETFAELFRPVLGEGTKEIIVGGVNSPEKARDAMKYTDLIAIGRENIIDPLFAEKILTGHEDEITDKISIDQIKNNGMTQGMIDNFSAPKGSNPLAGDESIKSLHIKPGAWSEMTYVDSPEMKQNKNPRS